MTKIVIIDYGMGNIRSIYNKIRISGYQPIVSNEISVIENADKIILPGVGHFLTGMRNLQKNNLIDVLSNKILYQHTLILGICLGMQLFSNHSEEGDTTGLGWIDSETKKFKLNDVRYKVPHIGWNSIKIRKQCSILNKIPDDSHYYFVHSYHLHCNNIQDVLATTEYGYEFVSAVNKDNIFGTQFHPEKSHYLGEQLLRNFLSL